MKLVSDRASIVLFIVSCAQLNTFPAHLCERMYRVASTALDLSGNIYTWASSQYKPYPYDPADGREDPTNAEARRVVRGGSWDLGQVNARTTDRYRRNPGSRDSYIGFRVVLGAGALPSLP